jgi:putative two-component system response regulator
VVRLAHYTRAIAQAAGARDAITDLIMKAAPLHDIGKLGVPAEVLRKQGALTSDEREQIERHPLIGADIIGEHDDPLLKLARTLALTHHERWDGLGYPDALAGENIPFEARVVAVADAFHAMISDRPYRKAIPPRRALEILQSGRGTQWDPLVVDSMLELFSGTRKQQPARKTASSA